MNFYEDLIKDAQMAGIKRYVVGAVIQKDSLVLLLKRPKDDFMGGIYELPSGKVEDDESLDSALYREVEEETGLRIREIKRYLGYFDYESESGEKTRQFNFVITVEEPIKIRLKEHDDFIWVNKNRLHLYPITDSVKKILNTSRNYKNNY